MPNFWLRKIRLKNDPNVWFVSAAGNDDNDGHSIYTPIKTIGKAQTLELSGGQSIFLRRTDSFAGRWEPDHLGTSGAWITFGAYGYGADPIVDGSASVGAMYIPSTAHYLRFENIDFSGSTGSTYATVTCQSSYIYFYSCTFRDSEGHYGFNGYDWIESGAVVHHVTLDHCLAKDNYGSGIEFGSVLGTQGPHDVLITHTEASGNGTTAWLHHGIYVRHDCVVEYCYCHDNPVGAGIKTNCQGVTNSPYTPIVRYNICEGNYLGIQVDNVNSIVHNNLCYANAVAAISLSADSAGGLIYHNTFANSTTAGEYLIRVEGDISGVTLKNNLFIQDAAVADRLLLGLVGTNSGCAYLAANNTWDYNTYYHSGVSTAAMFTDSLYTWADWTGWGAEPHGTRLLAVPGFVNRYTDFHPADGGNLKGLGVALAGYELDLDGKTRASPPTPGCYETAAAL